MKLHRNLVFATIDSLHLIFNENKQADKVLKNTLKLDKRWGARDRGFIACGNGRIRNRLFSLRV